MDWLLFFPVYDNENELASGATQPFLNFFQIVAAYKEPTQHPYPSHFFIRDQKRVKCLVPLVKSSSIILVGEYGFLIDLYPPASV